MMKKRKWLVITIVVLILLLVGVMYACRNQGDKAAALQDNVAENIQDEDTEKENLKSENISETSTDVDETYVMEDKTEEEPSLSTTQSEQTTPQTEHTHQWEDTTKTVHHDEEGHYEKKLKKEAWTEYVPVYENQAREICGNCGEDVTENPGAHIKQHMLNGTGNKGCRTEYREIQVGTETVNHPAEYEKVWVVDKKAWDETITIQKCRICGNTK